MAIRELGLANVEAVHGRAERLEPVPHAAVVAQALGPPVGAVQLMRPWWSGGILLLPAGPSPLAPSVSRRPGRPVRFPEVPRGRC
jgi:16S rRNA G527 N7-methylase RsmG